MHDREYVPSESTRLVTAALPQLLYSSLGGLISILIPAPAELPRWRGSLRDHFHLYTAAVQSAVLDTNLTLYRRTHSGCTARSVTSKYHHHFAHQMQFTWAHVTMIWLNVQHWQLPFHIHRHLHQLNTALLRPETLQKWRIMTTRWRTNSPYSVDYFHNHKLCVCTRLCILYITDTGDVKCFSCFFILVTFLRI